jgi:hypothetical protein
MLINIVSEMFSTFQMTVQIADVFVTCIIITFLEREHNVFNDTLYIATIIFLFR